MPKETNLNVCCVGRRLAVLRNAQRGTRGRKGEKGGLSGKHSRRAALFFVSFMIQALLQEGG